MKQWYTKILYSFCTTCRPNRSHTVRYAFSFILGLGVVLGAVAVTSQNATYVEVIASDTTITAGQYIELDVYVSAHRPTNAVDLVVSVPENQLEVMGIDTGESVITLWTEEPYYENGKVHMRGGTFRRGFVGRHLIATINVRAKASGLAYVNVTESLLLAGDGTASEIPATPNEGETARVYIGAAGEELASDDANAFSATAEVRIVTDIDGDGDVSLADVSRFMAAWTSKSIIFDFNGDGQMTFRDFAIILADSFFK